MSDTDQPVGVMQATDDDGVTTDVHIKTEGSDDQQSSIETAVDTAADTPHTDTTTATNPHKRRRYARQQIDPNDTSKYQRTEPTTEYNIWYNKYQKSNTREHTRPRATTRCNPSTDSGLTRADPHTAHTCIKYAQGRCPYGQACYYIHEIPDDSVQQRTDTVHDVFGRKRHATDSTDMGGIGCIHRDNRTLFVSGVYTADLVEDNGRRAADSVRKHFSVWGEIDHMSVKPKNMCVFVRYKNRVNAEFAKIAMADQSLDNDEQLNIRWAYDDPNPGAIKRIERENVKKAYDAILTVEQQQQQQQHQSALALTDDGQRQYAGPLAKPTAESEQKQEQYQYVGNGYYYDTVNQQYLYWDAETQTYAVYQDDGEQQTSEQAESTADQHDDQKSSTDTAAQPTTKPASSDTSDHQPASAPTNTDAVSAFMQEVDEQKGEEDDALAAFDSLLDRIDATKTKS